MSLTSPFRCQGARALLSLVLGLFVAMPPIAGQPWSQPCSWCVKLEKQLSMLQNQIDDLTSLLVGFTILVTRSICSSGSLAGGSRASSRRSQASNASKFCSGEDIRLATSLVLAVGDIVARLSRGAGSAIAHASRNCGARNIQRGVTYFCGGGGAVTQLSCLTPASSRFMRYINFLLFGLHHLLTGYQRSLIADNVALNLSASGDHATSSARYSKAFGQSSVSDFLVFVLCPSPSDPHFSVYSQSIDCVSRFLPSVFVRLILHLPQNRAAQWEAEKDIDQ